MSANVGQQRAMAELRKEAYGPLGDAARHRSLAELQAGLHALTEAPRRDLRERIQ